MLVISKKNVVLKEPQQLVLPEKEFLEVENYYKGLLTNNVLLEEAGRLAAKNRRILNRKDISDDAIVQQVKALKGRRKIDSVPLIFHIIWTECDYCWDCGTTCTAFQMATIPQLMEDDNIIDIQWSCDKCA